MQRRRVNEDFMYASQQGVSTLLHSITEGQGQQLVWIEDSCCGLSAASAVQPGGSQLEISAGLPLKRPF